jgi:hypothetical protein
MLELPEDTCVHVKTPTTRPDYPNEFFIDGERLCMKRRDDPEHLPVEECSCGLPALHHTFVMGERPRPRIKRLCDAFED